MLLSQRDRIQRLLLAERRRSPDISLPISNARSIQALTFDPLTDVIYWIEQRGVIRKARAQDGSQVHAYAYVTSRVTSLDRSCVYMCDSGIHVYRKVNFVHVLRSCTLLLILCVHVNLCVVRSFLQHCSPRVFPNNNI